MAPDILERDILAQTFQRGNISAHGHFGKETIWHRDILAPGYFGTGTFQQRDISALKHFGTWIFPQNGCFGTATHFGTGAKMSCAETYILLCMVPKFPSWKTSICWNILCKISQCWNISVPKYPSALKSLCQNVYMSKHPRRENNQSCKMASCILV